MPIPKIKTIPTAIKSAIDKTLLGAGEYMGTGKSKRLARAIADNMPVVNQNRAAKEQLINILIGEDDNYDNIFHFRNDLNLDEYFGRI